MANLTLTNVVLNTRTTDMLVAVAKMDRTDSGVKVGCRIQPASLSFRHDPLPRTSPNLEPAGWQSRQSNFDYRGHAALRAGRSVRLTMSGILDRRLRLGRGVASLSVLGSRPSTTRLGTRLRQLGRPTADKHGIV